MSLPREILPGRFYMITRRCMQRQFLLRPDAHSRATFGYCLALAAEQKGIVVILPVVLSNHHHTVVYDPNGRIAEFTQHLHHLVARAMNVALGRKEYFWSSGRTNMVRLDDREAVLTRLVYAATNPVKDHLVARVHQWPGVHGLSDLLNQREWRIPRPRGFFDEKGDLPAEVTLRPEIPESAMLGDADAFRAELRARVAAAEAELTKARGSKRVLGVRAIRDQSPTDAPTDEAPQPERRRTAGSSYWARVEGELRNLEFLRRYRLARLAWRAGHVVEFPPGTYWLRRFAGVTVAEA